MKYWKATLAGSMLAGGIVALSACSGTTTVELNIPGLGGAKVIVDHDDHPKNPDPPAPDLDQDTPSDQVLFDGEEYDIYGSDCPTWAVNSNSGRMFYLTNCSRDLAIVAPGGGGNGTGGSSSFNADGSTISSVRSVGWAGQPIAPVNSGSIEDALQNELARGFGDGALPIDPALSAFDLLTQFQMLDLDPSNLAYETPVDMAWRFYAVDDHFADVMFHLRTDQVILPPSLYNVQYEMYIKNDMDDGLPGYVRVRLRGDLNAVLAYFTDMGFADITVQDEIRGTEETIGADQTTREISWNGSVVPGLYADPTPEGIE